MDNRTKASIRLANGEAKYFRNAAHAWGAANPFTFGSITAFVGFVLGAVIF